MSEAPLRLTFAAIEYLDRTRALTLGTVRPEGIELESVTFGPYELFRRVAQGVEFDVAEMSASTYFRLVSEGDDRYVAIPIFPSRHFRHGYIFVHGASDISEPADLVGRRVGVPEYEMTAAVWQRAILQHEYGVRPDQIEWLQGGEFAPGYVERSTMPAPRGVSIGHVPDDRTLHDMVATGEIDAVFCPHRPAGLSDGSGRVRRLFPDYVPVEQEYFARTGFFPIMHLVVIRRDLYATDPWVAVALVEAFAKAQALGWARLNELGALGVMLPWLTRDLEEIQATMGPDHWKQGFPANRTILGEMCSYSEEQGLLARPVTPEEIFASETHALEIGSPAAGR